MKLKLMVGMLAAAGVMVPGIASATNGYFQHGIGVKEQSVGGAAIAFPQSAMVGATNPGAMTAVGRRIDLGLNWFSPKRSADNHNPVGYSDSGSTNFFIPEFGYNRMLNDNTSFGVVVYGNGGMNTDWQEKFFGTTNTYSNLEQLFIAPTMAFKITPEHSVGVSLNLVRQTFEARGLQNFSIGTPSNSTAFLTDVGEDTSTGWGVRLGYLGQVSPMVSVGAFWQPETRMSKFDKYRELFAESGKFDIPESYGAGLAVKANDQITVAADLVQIKYSKVPSIANLNNFGSAQLGAPNGPGFGWKDVTALKLGVAYKYNPDLMLRAGWNHGNNPLQSSETGFNILAPATITDHLTMGATWTLANKAELSVTYWHGFSKEVKGNFVAGNGADAADLKMHQDDIGIAYGWNF
ncbi:MAG: outer membrane protein transport protein [Pseudomonadota bacterium]